MADSVMPFTHDISAYRGDPFALTFAFEVSEGVPEDLTGSTFAGQLRTSADAPTVSALFAVTMPTPANGEVTVALSAATMATLRTGVPLVYDLQQTIGGAPGPTRVAGRFVVTADVTR